jgi:hypothetical protein
MYPRKLSVQLAIGAVLLTALCGCAFVQAATNCTNASINADKLVARLYKDDPGLIVNPVKISHLPRYFDERLTSLLVKEHNAPSDADTLPFDPMFDTNGGTAVKGFQVHQPAIHQKTATVVVEFTLLESQQKKRIIFSLNKAAPGWRITDLSTSDWDLVKVLTNLHG